MLNARGTEMVEEAQRGECQKGRGGGWEGGGGEAKRVSAGGGNSEMDESCWGLKGAKQKDKS